MNNPASESSKERGRDATEMEEVREWVEQARRGDEEAFGALVRTYHERLYGVVYRFAQNVDDANELVQQTWVKVWQKLHTFKGEAEFFTWVYRIATYAGLDFVRKRKRRSEDPLPDGLEPAREVGAEMPHSTNPRPDVQIQHGEIRDRFAAALQALTPEHRMTLTLREVEGLSYDEIARAMKCRKGTVMSRLYYARKQVQEQMREFL